MKGLKIALAIAVVVMVLGSGNLLAQNQAHPPREVDLYAAQLAVGGEYKTIWKVFNASAESIMGWFGFQNQSGKDIDLHMIFANGFEITSNGANLYAPSKTPIAMTLVGATDSLQVGFIQLHTTESWSETLGDYSPDLVGQAIYQRVVNNVVVSSVGVSVSKPRNLWLLDAQATKNTDTGIAIVNPNPLPATVTMKLFGSGTCCADDKGVRLPVAVHILTLKKGQQVSRFLTEYFAQEQAWKDYIATWGLNVTQNSLEISSDLPIAITAVRSDYGIDAFQMSSVPVFPGR